MTQKTSKLACNAKKNSTFFQKMIFASFGPRYNTDEISLLF